MFHHDQFVAAVAEAEASVQLERRFVVDAGVDEHGRCTAALEPAEYVVDEEAGDPTTVMIGMHGEASSPIDPEGKVFIRGEYWNARADQAIASGDPVEVESVDGLVLRVRRAESAR